MRLFRLLKKTVDFLWKKLQPFPSTFREDIPEYIKLILKQLRSEGYQIHFYTEGYLDCYVINGFIIKMERIPDEIMTDENILCIIDEMVDTHRFLVRTAESYGWKIE